MCILSVFLEIIVELGSSTQRRYDWGFLPLDEGSERRHRRQFSENATSVTMAWPGDRLSAIGKFVHVHRVATLARVQTG
jgi:hypothetical protein